MASADMNISTLRRKRGNIIGQITALSNVLDSSQDSGHCNTLLITEYLDGLSKAWSRFDDIQLDLEMLDASEETRRFEIQGSYYETLARAKQVLQDNEPPNNMRVDSNRLTTPTTLAPMAIKLPEMRLPTFDGTIENWTSFYDLFSSMIDRNDDLTPVQKLQYLRSTLTGKAAACIKSLKTTDTNYLNAIDTLREKFDCPRKTLLRHCDAIRDIPKLAKDTPEAIGDLLDTFNQHLRALRDLGQSIATWDAFLISTILSKINPDTIWQWELTLPDKTMPSYTHLIEFLQKRANCSTAAVSKPSTTPGNRYTSSVTNTKSRAQTYFAAKPAQCSICDGSHMVRDCETFNRATPRTRLENVIRKSLCHNCLRAGHSTDACRSIFTCRICNQRHHTLIHQQDNLQGQKKSTSSEPSTYAAAATIAPRQEDSDLERSSCTS